MPYYHAVFTLPPPAAEIAFQNKRVVYAILFRAAAEALPPESYRERHRRLTGDDLGVCPDCGGQTQERWLLQRRPLRHAPFWCDSS